MSRFLVADHPTLADALIVGVARWLDDHEVADRERWPKLSALWRRLEEDPAVLYAQAVETGETPAGSGACKGHIRLAEVIERFGS